MRTVEIKKVENGYIWQQGADIPKVFVTVEALFSEMLCWAEGRKESWIGAQYGKVTVERNDPNQVRDKEKTL